MSPRYLLTQIINDIFEGVIHQLDVAMEDVVTQRGGLVFVYNMYGSKYGNFDYDLSQKMLTLLSVAATIVVNSVEGHCLRADT